MVSRDQKSKLEIPPVGVVVWVTPRATGRPNDQRARIDGVEFAGTPFPMLMVTMLGDDKRLVVSPDDICGVEIFNDEDAATSVTIKFTSKRSGGDIAFGVSRRTFP